MSQQELLGYATAARILITIAGATVAQVKAMFGAAGMTEAQQNEILTHVIEDATVLKAISDAEAKGA